MSPGLPDNCRTVLECRTCKGGHFRVYWNWTPVDGRDPVAARWELNCAWCGATWHLKPDGLPNPEEIHDALVDVSLFCPADAQPQDGSDGEDTPGSELERTRTTPRLS